MYFPSYPLTICSTKFIQYKTYSSTEASDGELPLEPESDESDDDTELTNVSPEATTRDLVEKAKEPITFGVLKLSPSQNELQIKQ